METCVAQRPVVVGMNNPISSRPEYALFPYPPGCTGHRLFSLLRAEYPGVSRADYLRVFDRRNLLPTRTWRASVARAAADAMLPDLAGRVVLLLGREVRDAFGVPEAVRTAYLMTTLVVSDVANGVDVRGDTVAFYTLPHPSGRNLWYNDAQNRSTAGQLLGRLYRIGKDAE